MEIKVIEPIKNYLKEFNNPVEFNLWYAKNKDEVDKLTTHKLNKMYHIMGYRITKIKGELMLKEYMESQHSKLSIDDIVELKNDLQRKNISLENEMEKRNSSFTESLHEIARQNLRSAYMQVESKVFKGENQWEKVSVNQQPFIGIITMWVIPQNLIEE